MENLEDKLNSVLANPQMMSQIMAMAQSLGQSSQGNEPPQRQESEHTDKTGNIPSLNLDSDMMKKIFSVTQQAGIDNDQQNLLRALAPFLCQNRIVKLEKAMRAAKIASFAATALNIKERGL